MLTKVTKVQLSNSFARFIAPSRVGDPLGGFLRWGPGRGSRPRRRQPRRNNARPARAGSPPAASRARLFNGFQKSSFHKKRRLKKTRRFQKSSLQTKQDFKKIIEKSKCSKKQVFKKVETAVKQSKSYKTQNRNSCQTNSKKTKQSKICQTN